MLNEIITFANATAATFLATPEIPRDLALRARDLFLRRSLRKSAQ